MSEEDTLRTAPALTREEWYSEEQAPRYTTRHEGADKNDLKRIEKDGAEVVLWASNKTRVRVINRTDRKALAAIALRSFSTPTGEPVISHQMIDRIERGKATQEDVLILRSLLVPRGYEPST